MPRQIHLTLHLGAHKTATTHLQKSLSVHEEAIIADGIRLYGPDYLRQRGRNIPSLFGLTQWGVRRKPRRNPVEQLQFLAKGGRRVVITEENFLGALHLGDGSLSLPLYHEAGERVASLTELLPDAHIRVFLAIRQPDTFIESAYSQTLFSGHFQKPDAFAERHPVTAIDWVPVIRAIHDAPGVAEVYVWRYEDYREAFPLIMRRMLRWRLGAHIQPLPAAVHAGLSGAAVARVMERAAAGEGGPLANDARRDLPVGPDLPRFALFDSAVKAAAAADYARQVAEIEALPRVEFIRPVT